MLTVTAIDHLVLNVRDVEASAAWYQRTLGMTRYDSSRPSGETRTSVAFGINKINLRPVGASQDIWFTGRHPVTGSADLCFLTDATPDDIAAHMRRCAVAVELGPITRDGARGPICSIYVRDPDGNLIEISSYR